MKKFLLKFSVFAVYALLLQVVFPVLVDPFNVFHAECIRANGVEPNQNYIKTKYILNNPDKFDSFIFGSSRVSALHSEKMPGQKAYNMTYSVGLPSEHLANIRTFLKNKIRPARIYIGIDSISYTVRIESHILEPLRCPYEYLADNTDYFLGIYLDPAITFKSLQTILTRTSVIDVDVFYQYGWGIDYGRKSKFNWNAPDIKPSLAGRFSDETLRNALKDIGEIVNICRENNIELVIFTNPMHNITYMASVRELKYLEFLEGLADITEFYNFSSLNNITLSNDNYLETSHYKAETGDLILNVICSNEIYPELYAQGFGMKVTRDNAEEFIAMLKRQAENYAEKKQ